jgi:hypothetical protein
MTSRYSAFQALLAPRLPRGTPPDKALAPLRPLCAAADLGEFCLSEIASLEHVAIRMAIAAATGKTANGLLLLTPGQLRAKLVPLFTWSALADAMRERHAHPLRAALPDDLRVALDRAVQDLELGMDHALWDAVWEHAPDELVGKPAEQVLHGISATVWSYAALAVTDDDERRRLAPLMRLLSTGIVLGESVDLPGTWIVLAGT